MYIWKRLAKGDSRMSEYVEVGVGKVLDVRDRRVPCASALAARKAGCDGKGLSLGKVGFGQGSYDGRARAAQPLARQPWRRPLPGVIVNFVSSVFSS